MSIKIGDIDLVNEVVELHYQLIRTQLLLEEILRVNTNITPPNKVKTLEIDGKAIDILKSKFPNMGIEKK